MSSKRKIKRNKAQAIARQCGHKVRHATKHHACLAIEAMMRAEPNRMVALVPYECRYCGGWHVGHSKSGMKPMSNKNVRIEREKNNA